MENEMFLDVSGYKWAKASLYCDICFGEIMFSCGDILSNFVNYFLFYLLFFCC